LASSSPVRIYAEPIKIIMKPGLYLGDTPVEGFTGDPGLTNITAWLGTNAEDGKKYTIRLDSSEILERRDLNYGDKNVTIILTGTSSSRQAAGSGPVFSLDLARKGVLFHVGNNVGIGKVTLILSGDITLQGHGDNRLVREPGWFSNKSCKMPCILLFSAEFVRKLKFPNNSNTSNVIY
jgi:hypothetical protein